MEAVDEMGEFLGFALPPGLHARVLALAVLSRTSMFYSWN
jgi:hypothetical protein